MSRILLRPRTMARVSPTAHPEVLGENFVIPQNYRPILTIGYFHEERNFRCLDCDGIRAVAERNYRSSGDLKDSRARSRRPAASHSPLRSLIDVYTGYPTDRRDFCWARPLLCRILSREPRTIMALN